MPESLPLIARIVVGITFLASSAAFGIAGMTTRLKIVNEVNALLPEHERFAPEWWGPGKSIRLLRAYAALFPAGQLVRQEQWRDTGMFASMALFAVAIFPGVSGIAGALFFAIAGFLFVWVLDWLVLRLG